MKTSRVELESRFKDAVTTCRIWLQEHGELGLLIGLFSGVVLVLFFRWCLTLLVIGLLFGRLLWGLAEK